MGELIQFDPTTGLEGLDDFLSEGRGVDVLHFDRISNKTKAQYLYEVSTRDVDLVIFPDQRVVAVRNSVRVLILNPIEKMYLLEIGRKYPNGNFMPTPQDEFLKHSLRETAKRPKQESQPPIIWIPELKMPVRVRGDEYEDEKGETPIRTAIAGIAEETGIEADPSDIEFTDDYAHQDLHRSSVYEGTWAAVTWRHCVFRTTALSSKDGPPPITEGKTEIRTLWQPYDG